MSSPSSITNTSNSYPTFPLFEQPNLTVQNIGAVPFAWKKQTDGSWAVAQSRWINPGPFKASIPIPSTNPNEPPLGYVSIPPGLLPEGIRVGSSSTLHLLRSPPPITIPPQFLFSPIQDTSSPSSLEEECAEALLDLSDKNVLPFKVLEACYPVDTEVKYNQQIAKIHKMDGRNVTLQCEDKSLKEAKLTEFLPLLKPDMTVLAKDPNYKNDGHSFATVKKIEGRRVSILFENYPDNKHYWDELYNDHEFSILPVADRNKVERALENIKTLNWKTSEGKSLTSYLLV